MAKRKRDDKDTNKDKTLDAKPKKSEAIRLGVSLEDSVGIRIPPLGPSVATWSPGILTSSYYTPIPIAAGMTISPQAVFTVSPAKEQLEDEIATLRIENSRLAREIATKTKAEQDYTVEIEKLKENAEQLSKKQTLQYLLARVHESAHSKLLGSDKTSVEFRKRFEEPKPYSAVIMSVDIRRSTELMLKAKTPQLYADFITGLCAELTTIILRNYGVFDKFTGDGILAFFPEFYSGEDALYWSIKAADECHACFSQRYREKRNCFKSILVDVGLGIGIDYGVSHLVKIQDGLTVIGEPVVYACRFSGGEADQTLLNQSAYEAASSQFGEYINFQESDIEIKHEGKMLVYITTLSKKTYEPKLPDWLNSPTSPKS